MKKVFKIVAGIVVFGLIILITIPLVFQDKIVNLVKETINNNVNAQVDFSNANLSLLSNFPNASVNLENVTVINFEPFKGDTLFYGKEISLNLSLSELLKNSSEQLNIKSFSIKNALVDVKVDKNGKANYDISKTKATQTSSIETPSNPSSFGVSIKNYSIENSTIKYNDLQTKTELALTDFNHSGSGDFSQSNSELDTKTSTTISFGKDGTLYANNQKISLDAVIGMDLENKKFTFKENELLLNKLPLKFDGSVKVNEKNQEIALTFETPSSDFKNFLGLIPEAYAKNLNGVTTTGNFSVKGNINGIIDDKHIPKMSINVASNNASFKYPDLPKSVQNIHIDAQLKNTTGLLKNTFVNINNFAFQIDKDKFSGKGNIFNLTTNPKVDGTVNGTLNLGNINKAYPVTFKNELSGILKANLNTQFDVEAIQKNIVNRIKNSGHIEINDFVFSSKDIVNPLTINSAKVDFTPSTIKLTKFDALSGKSDFKATGKIDNLLGFLLSNKKLKGNFNAKSSNFYVSDFMQAKPENKKPETPTKEEAPKTEEALKIPAFLDCSVYADATNVYYDNLTLKNVKGRLLLKDEKAVLQNVNANIFNGAIALNGEINTQKKEPTFAMKLGIKSFNIGQSFNSLELLQNLSPIASAMDGKLNSDIDLSGSLNKDFTPNLTSVSGDALAELLTTKINPEKTKALSLLNDKLSFIDLTKLDLSDIKTKLSFKDGKVAVKPFKVKYQDIGINIGGTHGFDQTMNYNVTFDVPAKYLGNEVQGLLSKLSANDQNITVPVTANITGNMSSPSVKTDLSSSVTKLTQTLIQKQKDKLVNNTLNSLLGGGTKKDSTNKKNDVVKDVKDVLGGLFGKKKKKKDQ